jgi:NAD-dependent deacetylase
MFEARSTAQARKAANQTDQMPGTRDEALQAAAARLRDARSVVVFTGAGVSAESGIPTYRSGADGLWSRQNMERFANPAGYAANLPDSYKWYRARATGVAGAQPNAAHLAIARLGHLLPALTVVTQNIDSLHQRAGSRDVVELHGHLREFRCAACGTHVRWDEAPDAPRCTVCGGMLRPCVVMFHENLPEAAMESAHRAASTCDVLLSVGTSNQVWPAAELPRVALASGAWVIVVNPDLTDQPAHRRVVGIARLAGEALPAIAELVSPSPDAAP